MAARAGLGLGTGTRVGAAVTRYPPASVALDGNPSQVIRENGLERGTTMADVVYTSEVHLERTQGVLRRAYLPAESEPVWFGVHGAIARHYGTTGDIADPHATTIDYVVAAAAG